MTPGQITARRLITQCSFAAAFVLLFLAISALFVMLGSRALDQSGRSSTNATNERSVDVVWTDDATAILERIPWFVRDSVRQSAEQRARTEKISLITPDLLGQLQPGFAGAR